MNDNMLPPSKQPKRFFDVVPPHQSAPSATSKPVIVGNHPEQADPMVTGQQVTAEQPKPVEPATLTPDAPVALEHTINVQPTPAESTPFAAEVSEASKAPDPATRLMLEEYKEVEHELTPPVASTTANTLSNNSASIPAPPMVKASQDNQAIVAHHHKPVSALHGIILWLLVALSLLLLVNIILDAGLWKPTYNFPHTHFFKKY